MNILFRGVAAAQHIQRIVDHPACPRVGEQVRFAIDADDDEDTFSVRSVTHTPSDNEYDVYVVVGPPIRND